MPFSLRMVQRQDPRPTPNPVPKVGDGVTTGFGSDRYPGTIVSVSKSGLSFTFQDDNIQKESGNFMEGNWKGTFIPNPNAVKKVAKWSVRKGEGMWRYDGQPIGVGHRSYYQDPCF